MSRFIPAVRGGGVEQRDLTELTGNALGEGRRRTPRPCFSACGWMDGYATGIFSRRKIERASDDSVAFRYLAANPYPDHSGDEPQAANRAGTGEAPGTARTSSSGL